MGLKKRRRGFQLKAGEQLKSKEYRKWWESNMGEIKTREASSETDCRVV